MAFEKMTAKELYDIFYRYFPDWAGAVVEYQKIGARALKLRLYGDRTLYFMWYDETNWTLGTKLYRKPPKKAQKRIDELKNELAALDAQREVFQQEANRLYREKFGFGRYN